MATMIFKRATPFQRGDMSLQIFMDGKVAGTLTGSKELTIEVASGIHQIQAEMCGLRGEKQMISIREDNVLNIAISGTRIKTTTYLHPLIWLFLMACSVPIWWLQLIVISSVGVYSLYQWKQQKDTLPKLEQSESLMHPTST